ncbi:hypothetical protein MJO28_005026 [Puccinia striiformis f. sp. tritici]|uniref:Uncharacterized protein n=1 Tax=Puccinia striiformis f. sp. tritici TaxID=168172 RepID=A0ACC0EMJ4_9BASI|nr:hypothetical protein MJO28_005026 [Puccinia striiformis f. sp. tritici]
MRFMLAIAINLIAVSVVPQPVAAITKWTKCGYIDPDLCYCKDQGPGKPSKPIGSQVFFKFVSPSPHCRPSEKSCLVQLAPSSHFTSPFAIQHRDSLLGKIQDYPPGSRGSSTRTYKMYSESRKGYSNNSLHHFILAIGQCT